MKYFHFLRSMGIRFSLILVGIACAYFVLLSNLYHIQIQKGEYYLARARAQSALGRMMNPTRGVIYFTDRNGDKFPAAMQKEFPIIYAVPKEIEDPLETASVLAPILGRPAEELARILLKRDDAYELLVRKAETALVKKIEELGLRGIYNERVPMRFYPFGTRAAHVIGYVGPDEKGPEYRGHYGIEQYYDEVLSAGTRDIVLTIDPSIQAEAERVLQGLIETHGATGGSVIIAEPTTGKILAMGSFPAFDPNNYRSTPLSNFLNPAVEQRYEPGSVLKVLTMAAGIDSGKITPETTYVDKGTITLNRWTIQNWDLKERGPYGRIDMWKVLERSVNTGAVFIQRTLGRDLFTQYLKKFGIGEKTDIKLPGELPGDMRRLNHTERDVAFATASYGQGVAVTPLLLLHAVGAIANKGVLMKPLIIADDSPVAVRRVVSEAAAEMVTKMMVNALDKAEIAKINGYTLAGKTGTAFIPDFKKGGYTEQVINTYVGFGPTSNPRFIILIKLDRPRGAPIAGLTVVPAFRDLAQFMINYYNIQPDRL